jgi:tetratricopeptide (TPR) repeat protein
VAAGLQAGEPDWVNEFIHHYKNALERPYRESSFSFNLARLEYARRRYDAVLELLQKANYHDPLLNLAAKTLLLKTWYELGEYDLLQSHLDAMRNYIRRKRVIGYHKTNYLNIVKYTEKLLKINLLNPKETAELKAGIHNEEILTEREWLLGWLD